MDFSKLTATQILNLSPEDLSRLNKAEWKSITAKLNKLANKRIKRLSQSDIGKTSPAYITASKRGGKFNIPTKAKIAQIRSEFKSVKQFLKMKTSTVSGWKDVRTRVAKEIGEMTEWEEKKFWKIYRNLEETNGGFLNKHHKSRLNSERIQKLLHDTITAGSRGWRTKRSELEQAMQQAIDYEYEVEQTEINEGLEDIDNEFDY